MEIQNESEQKFVDYITNTFENLIEKAEKSLKTNSQDFKTKYSKLDFNQLYALCKQENWKDLPKEQIEEIFQEVANKFCKMLGISPLKIYIDQSESLVAGKYDFENSCVTIFTQTLQTKSDDNFILEIQNALLTKTIFHECYHHYQKNKLFEFLNGKDLSSYDLICCASLLMYAFYDKTTQELKNLPELKNELFDEYTYTEQTTDYGLKFLPAETQTAIACYDFNSMLKDKNLFSNEAYNFYTKNSLQSNSPYGLKSFNDPTILYSQEYAISCLKQYNSYLMPNNLVVKKLDTILSKENWESYNKENTNQYEKLIKIENDLSNSKANTSSNGKNNFSIFENGIAL